MKPRVLLAGLYHETNTFLGVPTRWSDFAVVRGKNLLGCLGDASPVDGVLAVARERGWDLLPAIDARAVPSGEVDDDALESYWAELRAIVQPALKVGLDAIFLVLHGAMVTRSETDVEGELVSRLRRLPGGEGPLIFGVLDLHGNISPRMCQQMNGWVAYRCNPHTDAKQAAERAARLLDRALQEKVRPRTAWCRVPVIWAPPGTGSADDPMKSLLEFASWREQAEPRLWAYNVVPGFSFADTEYTGASLSVVTAEPGDWTRRELSQGAALAWRLRETGNVSYPSADAVAAKLAALPETGGPVLMVEPADNIGGGAPGDGTGVLRAMLRHRISRGLVAINDPSAVDRLAEYPVGGRVELAVGGRSWPGDEGPVPLEAEILSRSDGKFTLEDPQSHLASLSGLRFDMGRCVVLRHGGLEGVTVLVTSRKTPPFDLGQFRSQGVDPVGFRVIGVKAAVAHRRAYDPIAAGSYYVATPGPCGSDLSTFPYRKVHRPVWPLDPLDLPTYEYS